MTIAVDFDGCLCENKWPDIGKPVQPVINELVRRQAEGDKLILWTCREGQMLDAAILWCLNHGLRFDAINDNLEKHKDTFGNNCRKVYADEYWDDKSTMIIYAGSVCSIARKDHDGGVTVKQWRHTQLEILEPPREAKQYKRRKRWWQR